MKDKSSNALIVFILIIIAILGTMYYVKVIRNKEYSLDNVTIYSEENWNNSNRIYANTYAQESSVPESRPQIGNVSEAGEKVYTANNELGYKYNNRYYYNRLDKYSQVIYDAISNNLDNLKTGNYTIVKMGINYLMVTIKTP